MSMPVRPRTAPCPRFDDQPPPLTVPVSLPLEPPLEPAPEPLDPLPLDPLSDPEPLLVGAPDPWDGLEGGGASVCGVLPLDPPLGAESVDRGGLGIIGASVGAVCAGVTGCGAVDPVVCSWLCVCWLGSLELLAFFRTRVVVELGFEFLAGIDL